MSNLASLQTPKPYNDIKICETSWIREFCPNESAEDYVWHRDLEDRHIVVLEGCGWMFQFDNELPFFINKNDDFFVPKMVYHRIIPGTSSLKVRIDEMVDPTVKLAIA
jgi:hypothetical protein